jgi:pimeloyl-ACP methyl ester carboxylesterase
VLRLLRSFETLLARAQKGTKQMVLSKADWDRVWEMPLQPTSVRFPVTVAGRQEEIAGWVFAPPVVRPEAPPLVVDLLAGATYTKSYWHLTGDAFPGKTYSLAQYLVEHLHAIVIACDHPGTGESSRPSDGYTITLECLAETHAQVIHQLRDHLGKGTLLRDMPPLPAIRLLGGGHSMGAAVQALLQGQWQLYDAVALLGWTQGAIDMTRYDQALLQEVLVPNAQGYIDPLPLRVASRPVFYGGYVTDAQREADERLATPMPGGILGALMTPGATAAAAKKISVPVYLAFGSLDVSSNPHGEVAAYTQAQDVSLFILPDSPHCHNLAPSHPQLWHHLAEWMMRLSTQTGFSEAA